MRDVHEAGPAGVSMRQMPPTLRRIAATCLFAVAFCWPLAAATVSKLNDDVLAPLRGPVVARRIHIDNMPLYAHGTVKIDLEEFQVWAPGAKVIVSDGKSVQYLDPPPMRFFRGLVNGDPESFAYFSIEGTTGAISGLIATRDGRFATNASRRRPAVRPHAGGLGNDPTGDYDYYLTAMDDGDELSMAGQTWACEVEKLPGFPPINKRILAETDAGGHPVTALGISGTQSYAIAVEVETDFELYQNAGSNVTTATTYITNLSGAVSTIYNRDIHTNLLQQNVHIYTSASDPWSATDAPSGLTELGNYYHANHATLKRSAVVMLSGKSVAEGIAYEGVVCGSDFSTGGGNFGGAYAWAGGIGNLFGFQGLVPVPDPNATNNGIQYGMPGDGTPMGTQTYWPLEEYAHELGHNLAGHHTHCVAITLAEALGTNHPTQAFVDVCDTTEGGACATGTASAPPEKGTIMSYCHILAPIPQQSRYTLGQASELSHHELDDYMLNASGPMGGGINIVTAVGTFSMSSISGSSSVAANSTGNVASVTPVNGGSVTYFWTITGGTIPGSSTGSSVTYTAGASGSVVLRANLFNTNGCGVTDTKTVTINTCTGAAITTQPSSTTIVTGQTATLSVGASGTATISYQWYVGNSGDTSSPVGGGTGASVNVSPASNTSYWVRVSNSCGTADSNTATVTVTTNPPSAATLFYLVTPCRVIDTRNANGPQGGPALASGGTRTITVAGVCGIPTGVVAISVNVAVVAPSGGGFLTLFTGPSSVPVPLASSINYQTNRTLANNAIVKVGSDTINAYDGGPTINFVIDVNGYFK
jgi:hypothetical protein